MLQGQRCRLRLVHEADLPALQHWQEDLAHRGDYFPLGVVPRVGLDREFSKSGFWQEREGLLLIVDADDTILGHIEFFGTVAYLDELELSYIVYDPRHRGRGVASDAVALLCDYLFGRSKVNRLRLVIHPDNAASRRVAARSGFTLEGVMRGAWYHQGHNHDVQVWARLRDDPAP